MLNKILSLILLTTVLCPIIAFSSQTIPVQTKSDKLYARIPEEIKATGVIVAAFDSFFPPFATVENKVLKGMSVDLAQALSEILGIKIEQNTVTNFPSMLSGVQAGRYQIVLGPIGDFVDRQVQYDFVDFMKDMAVFAVRKGNPLQINSVEDLCGKRVATTKGGASEQVLIKKSKSCTDQNKSAIDIQAYPDTASNLLAVRSNRADVVMDTLASLSHFVQQDKDQIQLSGTDKDTGLGIYYMASVLAKDSPLTPVVRDAYQQLFDNGTYAAIICRYLSS
ncbi:MAG: ABC transporter substrate-binding protein [Enterobacteriaceae bacterium]